MENLMNKLMGSIVFLIISIVVNVTHAVLTLIEVVQMPSDLSVGADRPFLIIFMVLLFVFALWQVWIMARVWALRNTVKNMSGGGSNSTEDIEGHVGQHLLYRQPGHVVLKRE